ncbi:MCP four helix bundle domain-containing protein [Bacillus sonorensis]|nr:MCP four helix bundle domain-containing protein [Bacillus sonorensis]
MKLLKNIKIRSKLFIIIVISALALAIVGIQGITDLSRVSKGSEKIYEGQLIPNQLFSKLRVNSLEIDTNNFELMVTKDNSINEKLQKNVQEKSEENIAAMEQIDKLNLAENIKEKYETFKTKYTDLQNASKNMLQLALENKNKEAYAVYQKDVEPQRTAVNQLFEEIQALNSENAKTIYQQDSKDAGSTITLLIIMIAASLILSISMRSSDDKIDCKTDSGDSKFVCQD